jgi:SAM-dependent MidA family methyltransferase
MSLRATIEQEIRERGPIPFSRYMEICLYDPAQGYYSRNAEQFGKAGDFYTSSDVHAVYGRLLARQFEEMWRALDRPPQLEILELGPGRGLFARDVLDWSKKKFPDFFAALTYTLQESSPALRARLRETLRDHVVSCKAAISERKPSPARAVQESPGRKSGVGVGNDGVPKGRHTSPCRALAPPMPLIVFANEFFDALPVEILGTQGKLHLALERDRLREIWLPPSAEELEFLDRYSVHPEPGERIEVSLPAQKWITQIAHAIERGFLLIIDYGYTRDEQLAGHHRGTLMAYRQHSTSASPYQAPGEQDLTAHVNFTALAGAAAQAGMQVQSLLTQSQFLMRIGEANQFADAFEDCRLPQERAKVALQLKHLVTPAGMGETFQVLVGRHRIQEITGLGR